MPLAGRYPTPESLPAEPIRCTVGAHLRRAMWLLSVGTLLACVIAGWVVPLWLNLPPPPAGRLPATAVMVGFYSLPAALLWAFGYSIEVDAAGIRKCPRFGRRVEMAWSDLAAGRISPGQGLFSYRWNDAEDRECRLSLAGLEDEVADWLQGLIRQVWMRPPAPPPPEHIECRLFGGIPWTEVRADAEGVTVRKGKVTSSYAWADVQSLEIWHSEHERYDFEELRLSLGGEQLEWRRVSRDGNRSANWNGSTAEEINLFLQEYVPPERVSEFAAMLMLLTPGLGGLLLGAFFEFHALIPLKLRRDLERAYRESQAELLAWLKQLAADDVAAGATMRAVHETDVVEARGGATVGRGCS